MRVIHLSSQTVLVAELSHADTFLKRLQGLMFRTRLSGTSGLLISPCQQVHTHFMRFAIDVLFLDDCHQVLHIERNMQPWRFSRFIRQGRAVLEVNAGGASSVMVGDRLHISRD